MSAAGRETFEAHLVDCPACLLAVREVSAILAETVEEPVPPGLIERARTLVPAEPLGRPSRWRISEWLAAGRWGAATAASIAICLVGYRAGTISFVAEGAAGDQLAADMSFGVFDARDDDADLDLLLLDFAEVSP